MELVAREVAVAAGIHDRRDFRTQDREDFVKGVEAVVENHVLPDFRKQVLVVEFVQVVAEAAEVGILGLLEFRKLDHFRKSCSQNILSCSYLSFRYMR